MPENVTTEPDGESTNVLAELTNFDLDQKIGAKIQVIGNALAGRDRAVEEVEKCKKSAVLSAWRLGQFLIEKKSRLAHGEWLPWLYSLPSVSHSSASDYMRLARQIASAGNLGSSIRATLRALPEPTTATPKSAPTTAVKIDSPATATPKSVAVKVDSPATATPKSVAVKVDSPATATPKSVAVKIVEPAPVWPTERDSAAMIEGLETELYQEREKNETLEERIALMTETADPKSRKAVDKLNNQAELIRTLKASSADWQSKAGAARKEVSALKRKAKALETELDRRRPRHAA